MHGPLRVLIADDSRSMRSLIRSAFPYALRRIEFEDVGDGLAAIDAYRARRFDIAVVDVMMPGADGFEVLAALRAYDEDALVTLISGASDPGLAAAARDEGAADFVRKPITQQAALRMLAMADQKRRPASALVVDASEIGPVTLKFGLDALHIPHRLCRATSGGEAMQALNRIHIDVAFVDPAVAGRDGLFFLSQIRAQHPHVYLVKFSEESTPEAVRAALDHGADDYLLKNISLEHLKKMWGRFRAKCGGG